MALAPYAVSKEIVAGTVDEPKPLRTQQMLHRSTSTPGTSREVQHYPSKTNGLEGDSIQEDFYWYIHRLLQDESLSMMPTTAPPPPPTDSPTGTVSPPTGSAPDREVPIGDSFQITQDVTAGATCGTEEGLNQSKVEVCLLSDASNSFIDDLPNLDAASGSIFNDVSSATDEAKFGVAAFIDYPVSGFGVTGDYPYMLLSSMSSSFDDWNDGINNIVLGSGGDPPESQYDGIVGAAQGLSNSFVNEPDCGWTNDPTVQRIMVVSTDAPFHTPITTIHENDLASTTAILQQEQIRLIGLKAFGAQSELDSLAAATGGSVQPLSSDGSDIAKAILGGLEDLPCLITPITMGCEPLEVAFEPPNQTVPPGGSATFTGVFTVPNVDGLIGSTVTCDVLFSANGDIVETIPISVLITPP
jgi:hypothetical protein